MFQHELRLSDRPDWLALPATRGVVVFEGDDGAAAGIAVTADIRALVRRRLEVKESAKGQDIDSASRPTKSATQAGYQAVTRRVLAATAGSAWEAELLQLEAARQRLPGIYQAIVDRRAGWFLHMNTDHRFPRLEKLTSNGLAERAGSAWADHRHLIGPLRDKHACGKFMEQLQEVFDLCRYHHILVQAPHGAACVYKELGKCPAPCDGSESMPQYRGRAAAALQAARGYAAWSRAQEAAMRQAASALEYEAAAAIKQRLEAAAKLRAAEARWAGGKWEKGWLVLAAAEQTGWLRVFSIGPGWREVVADVAVDAAVPTRRAVLQAALRPRPARLQELSREQWRELGLMCWWLYRPAKKLMEAGVTFMAIDDATRRPELVEEAWRTAARSLRSGGAKE